MKFDPLRDKKYQLLKILREHDVQGMKVFIDENPAKFSGLTEEQKHDDQYLFDVLHLYKSQLLYMGKQYFESVNYCLNHGIIRFDEEQERLFRLAENNQEAISECAITEELGPDLLQ